MSDDSNCDSGDPNYADWVHGPPSLPKDNLAEDEMLRCTFADIPNSEILEEFVEELRESRKTLDYEVRVLRMADANNNDTIESLIRQLDEEKEKNKKIESLRRELVEEKEKNKQIQSRESFNAFVWGFVIGVALFAYFMYY